MAVLKRETCNPTLCRIVGIDSEILQCRSQFGRQRLTESAVGAGCGLRRLRPFRRLFGGQSTDLDAIRLSARKKDRRISPAIRRLSFCAAAGTLRVRNP